MTEPAKGVYVFAGVNGAGKTSVIGRALADDPAGAYFNPDAQTRVLMEQNPALSEDEANGMAWSQMVAALRWTIENRQRFAFETTLGGGTVTGMLLEAARAGTDVYIWYVGLATPQMHVERVRSRVARGGHSVSEEKIHARYVTSREHLVQLLPVIKELWLYDNSSEAAVDSGARPEPTRILHVRDGRIAYLCPLSQVPAWAEAVVVAAMLTFQ